MRRVLDQLHVKDEETDAQRGEAESMGKGEKMPLPSSGSFGWLKNQIDTRQICKRK